MSCLSTIKNVARPPADFEVLTHTLPARVQLYLEPQRARDNEHAISLTDTANKLSTVGFTTEAENIGHVRYREVRL
jgi:hypothetical protein